jgi:putative flippase GtrA
MFDRLSPQQRQLLRFVLAGLVNTVAGLAVFAACIRAGTTLLVALLAANLFGLFFNFITTGGYAFRQLSASRWPRFAGVYALLLALNWVLVDGMQSWGWGVLTAQALVTVPLAFFSYWLQSRWVFAASPTRR